jgi:hypothetical protein
VLRFESETGHSVECIPKSIKAFGLHELFANHNDSHSSFSLQLDADSYIFDNDKINKNTTINTSITFNEQVFPFALISDGWLPLPLVHSQRFLVDRNVISSLRKLRERPHSQNLQAFRWWTSFFNKGTPLFNPLPYAWEGSFRRRPTFSEFIDAYEEGSVEIKNAFPKANITSFDSNHLSALYQFITSFESRDRKEADFLCSICPLISNRVPRNKEKSIADKIRLEAKRVGVRLNSFVFISVLSCLYDDCHGNLFSIGRKLLKPKIGYGVSEAFNALSDLRNIELAAAIMTCFPENPFAIATCDYALASFWCALSLRGLPISGKIEFHFKLTKELFPRLEDTDLKNIEDLIKE